MKKTIQFPQIVIETREIEISEKELKEIGDDISEFVWSQMTDFEKQHTCGLEWCDDLDLIGFRKQETNVHL